MLLRDVATSFPEPLIRHHSGTERVYALRDPGKNSQRGPAVGVPPVSASRGVHGVLLLETTSMSGTRNSARVLTRTTDTLRFCLKSSAVSSALISFSHSRTATTAELSLIDARDRYARDRRREACEKGAFDVGG